MTLRSGEDTTLESAQVRGDSINADIGGDLTITSQQDSSTFEQEQTSTSLGGSYGTNNSISFSRSELTATANYEAVQEQSGLFAGEGGFDVNVENNTALTGGVIVSTAAPDNNRLSTESLSTQNIKNVSEFDIESKSISVGISGDGVSIGGGAASDSGRDTNSTYSAISDGTIDVRSGDTTALANIKGSEVEAHTVLENNFNTDKVQDVQDQLAQQQLASELVGEAVNDYAKTQLKAAETLEKQAKAATDAGNTEEGKVYQAQADAIKSDWGTDSYQRRIITATISGALGGNLEQTLGTAASQSAFQLVGDLYEEQEKAQASLNAAQLANDKTPGSYSQEHIDSLREDLQTAEANGPAIRKDVAHAIAGGISAALTGGNIAEGALAAGANEFINQELGDIVPTNNNTRNLLATAVGGAIGGVNGATITNTADTFNRQLHQTEIDLIKANAERFAEELSQADEGRKVTPEEAKNILTQVTLSRIGEEFDHVADENSQEFIQATNFLDKLGRKNGTTVTDAQGRTQTLFNEVNEDYFKNRAINLENVYDNRDLYNPALQQANQFTKHLDSVGDVITDAVRLDYSEVNRESLETRKKITSDLQYVVLDATEASAQANTLFNDELDGDDYTDNDNDGKFGPMYRVDLGNIYDAKVIEKRNRSLNNVSKKTNDARLDTLYEASDANSALKGVYRYVRDDLTDEEKATEFKFVVDQSARQELESLAGAAVGQQLFARVGAIRNHLGSTKTPKNNTSVTVAKEQNIGQNTKRPEDIVPPKSDVNPVPEVNPPKTARDEFTGPYDSNTARADLEATHGADNVTSTTNPNNPLQTVNSNPNKGIEVITDSYGNKAVRVKFDDPVTGVPTSANIPYNNRGLPVFDDHAKYTTNIDKTKSYDAQFSQATRDLRDGINSGKVDSSQFTANQLSDIKSGSKKIEDFTWHHNADSGNMQLIPTDVHKAVKHVGDKALSGGK